MKPLYRDAHSVTKEVAPHAGAWIETFNAGIRCMVIMVAPHAGAWIETAIKRACSKSPGRSPPTRGRGLKLVPEENAPGSPGRRFAFLA